jgi:hypothetical protein
VSPAEQWQSPATWATTGGVVAHGHGFSRGVISQIERDVAEHLRHKDSNRHLSGEWVFPRFVASPVKIVSLTKSWVILFAPTIAEMSTPSVPAYRKLC